MVAGATRGAGRGIAAAFGEVGATVICTGRSSEADRGGSDYDRRETIEEAAALVTRLGGTGIAIKVDHLDADRGPTAPEGFAASESPRYVVRAIAALAADPDRTRWNQASVSSAQLAREYGFTDIDGSQPDSWAAL